MNFDRKESLRVLREIFDEECRSRGWDMNRTNTLSQTIRYLTGDVLILIRETFGIDFEEVEGESTHYQRIFESPTCVVPMARRRLIIEDNDYRYMYVLYEGKKEPQSLRLVKPNPPQLETIRRVQAMMKV